MMNNSYNSLLNSVNSIKFNRLGLNMSNILQKAALGRFVCNLALIQRCYNDKGF